MRPTIIRKTIASHAVRLWWLVTPNKGKTVYDNNSYLPHNILLPLHVTYSTLLLCIYPLPPWVCATTAGWLLFTCDLTWENRAYVHIKFDHFWTSNFTTLCSKEVYQWNFYKYMYCSTQWRFLGRLRKLYILHRSWDTWNNLKVCILCT